ncbi:Prophage Lp2 protein 54 [Lactiplantibacillus plantarum]|nr:Prophage Lp2 protein 54 [Lactiplantibacillus plantarum]
MSFDLSEFLTEGLIDSVNNGLIPSDLATVYAGNYLVKSLITQTQVTQVSDAITVYKAAQAEATAKASKEAQEVAKRADSSLAAQTEATVDNNNVH